MSRALPAFGLGEDQRVGKAKVGLIRGSPFQWFQEIFKWTALGVEEVNVIYQDQEGPVAWLGLRMPRVSLDDI